MVAAVFENDCRLWDLASLSLSRSLEGRCAAPVDPRSGAAGVGAAGLVSSKTSVHDTVFTPHIIPTDDASLRERRVKGLRKNVWSAGKLLSQSCGKGFRCWFVTLTYRGVDDWSPRHISDALKRFRIWCDKRGTKPRYVWVAELQQRGAIHYHLAIWLPMHLSCPMWDKPTRAAACFWPHGMTNRQLARNAVGYLMKYMSKVGKHHVYPKHARIYGAGGLESPDRQIRAWLNLPQWIKQLHGVGEVVRRQGRRLVRETGEVLCSPFRVLWTGGGLLMQTIGPVPGRWVDGPYSSLTPA